MKSYGSISYVIQTTWRFFARNATQGTGRIMNPKILPTILIIIDVLASIPYCIDGDWRRCIYWLAAGTLTYVVTW